MTTENGGLSMAINVKWDDDSQHLIYWSMEQGWTWDDFTAAVGQSVDMMNTVTHRVDLLAVSQTAIMPTADAIGPFRRSVTQKLAHHNGGYLLIVGGGRVVPVLMNFLKSTLPPDEKTFLDIRFHNTEEAARRFLAQHSA